MLAVLAVVALAWRDAPAAAARPRLDVAGFAAFLGFLVPLVIALMEAPEWGWGSAPVLGLFAASAAGLALFVSIERRVRDPLIDVGLLRPQFVGANLVILCAQFSKMAVLVFGALLLQDSLGMSALEAGTALLVAMIPPVVTSLWSGRLTDRTGPRVPILAGVAVMITALLWLAVFASQETYLLLAPGFLLWGVAISFLFNPAYATILGAVAAGQRGEASGVTATGRQLGGAIAVAVLGAVLLSAGGFAAVFAVAAAVTVGVWVATWFLIDRPAPSGRAPVAASAPVRAE
jgi:predicted MFS family arabinose efflux permease